jgi:hypothetical protein
MLWGIRVPRVLFAFSPSTGISGETLRQLPNGDACAPQNLQHGRNLRLVSLHVRDAPAAKWFNKAPKAHLQFQPSPPQRICDLYQRSAESAIHGC